MGFDGEPGGAVGCGTKRTRSPQRYSAKATGAIPFAASTSLWENDTSPR